MKLFMKITSKRQWISFLKFFWRHSVQQIGKKIAISSVHLCKRFTFAEKQKFPKILRQTLGVTIILVGILQVAYFFLYFRTLLLWKDEPTSKSFGGYSSRNPAIVDQVECIIKDGVSIMVSDVQGKLVGIRLSHTIKR